MTYQIADCLGLGVLAPEDSASAFSLGTDYWTKPENFVSESFYVGTSILAIFRIYKSFA